MERRMEYRKGDKCKCPYCGKIVVRRLNQYACGHIDNIYFKEYPSILPVAEYVRVFIFSRIN